MARRLYRGESPEVKKANEIPDLDLAGPDRSVYLQPTGIAQPDFDAYQDAVGSGEFLGTGASPRLREAGPPNPVVNGSVSVQRVQDWLKSSGSTKGTGIEIAHT